MRRTNGRAARTSAPHSSYLIQMSSPTSKRTGSSSITISASAARPVSPIRGTTGRRESMDFMATDYAGVLRTPKKIIPTRRSTSTCRAASRSLRRQPSKSVSMSSTFSTQSTNCATAAASAWARLSLANVAVSTGPSPTSFEVGRSLSRL